MFGGSNIYKTTRFLYNHYHIIVTDNNATPCREEPIDMNFEELYTRMRDYFETKDYASFGSGVYSYEFDVTGEGAGKFYLEVRDGSLDMQPYDYKNSTCGFKISSGHLEKLIDRSLAPIAAYSSGRLRIKGDVSAAFRLADALGL